MDPDYLKAIEYVGLTIGGTVGTSSFFKYLIRPLFCGTNDAINTVASVINHHLTVYSKTIESRGSVAAELVKTGKNLAEITDFLDQTLPLPQKPELTNLPSQVNLEEEVETAL